MRIERILISLTALFLSCFLIVFGFLLWAFPEILIDLESVGVFFLSLGFLLLLLFLFLMRRRYLLLKMGGVSIDERLVVHFVKEVLKELFPKSKVDCDVILHKHQKMEILANIPYLSEESCEPQLEEIETRLSAELLKHFGLNYAFIFNLNLEAMFR
ncbi:MAG: hypothetical protein R3E91_05130 [Chlamydiales bacterium]